MFGTRLRTWMEAHIVRSKKKKDRKKGDKGFDSNCNSPNSTKGSPPVHQVHPVNSPSKNVDSIHLHTATYTTGVTNSSGASGGTGSVNLSSPESAYSTGYSTDGTSPGASFPPEYYINIRTGTHYFQSSKAGRVKRPGDSSSCLLNAALLNGNGRIDHQRNVITDNGTMTRNNKIVAESRTSVPSSKGNLISNGQKQQQQHPQQLPQQQQQQKQQHHHHQETLQHRRTESYSAESPRNGLPVPSSIPPPLLSPSIQSPRERSRIRTNPWLSANSSSSSTTGFKSRLTLDETSSSSGLKLTESSGSASDVNINNPRENQARREYRQESLSAGRSPINQNWRIPTGIDLRNKIPLAIQRRNSSSSSGSSVTQSIRSSEDDITLNEMMGKFDESYVYEKETDILSDSDPTDCEDYIDSLSDVDTGQDGGDENDPFENDFDYIDNGSFLDLDNMNASSHFTNTGHCTYFTFTGEMSRRGSRLRESFLKRKSKEDSISHRSASVRSNIKRQSIRHKKIEDKTGEKRKKRSSQRRKHNFEKCDDEIANMNRVLVERMLLKNSGFNQGSRSVGGTPICLRRKKHDVNKNLSPMRLNDNRLSTEPALIDTDIVKRRSNSVSYVNGNLVRHQISGNTYMTTFASEIALIEADKEADRKYRELISEAENILVNMQKNVQGLPIVPSPSRKLHNGLANKRVELIKNTELNIELALLKSRNSQPELQSGSIKDIEHTSPKRHFTTPCSPIHRFIERNAPGGCYSPRESISRMQQLQLQQEMQPKCPDSPALSRRTSQNSPNRTFIRNARLRTCELESLDHSRKLQRYPDHEERRFLAEDPPSRGKEPVATSQRGEKPAWTSPKPAVEHLTSSSSDSEDKVDARTRTPLLTFRSVDMGPIREGSSYCPQSEPVKRKVYAGSATYGRIQKTLGEHHVMLRNSDGDTATDDTDDSRRSLRERVAQLRQERLHAAETNLNDTQMFQHQLSQIRRQMLMQTIEGLKRSLEDQSATLKQTCLEPILTDELP